MIKHSQLIRGALVVAGAAAILSVPAVLTAKPAFHPVIIRGAGTPTISVYATGFNDPRELKFGPDGLLYVAEGGNGGTHSTVGQCTQTPFPVGPATGDPTGGRISRVVNGVRETVTDQFPTTAANPIIGGDIQGVADIAFMGNTLYALTAGGGCSHGVLGHPNGIYRVNGDGSTTLIANLSAFLQSHPVKNPEPDDFEPDGTWYSMVAVRGSFYAVEPNHGEVDRITTSGAISRVVDISATQGHIVPTAIAHHGVFYVGNLGNFPITPGSEKILQITPSGQLHTVATGLTTVLGIAFDNRARMYVLENTVAAGFPTDGQGDIVRFTGNKRQVIVSGLDVPTGMTMGPDGALYVSVFGFHHPPGTGKVLRITLPD